MMNKRDAKSVMDNATAGQSKAGHFYLIGSEIAKARGDNAASCRIRLNRVNYRVGSNHPWR